MPDFIRRYGTAMACVLLFAIMGLTADNFLNPYNLLSIFKHVSFLTIISLGFTLALASGELDLSFAHIASFASVCTASLLFGGYPIVVAVATGLSCGALLGVANGLIVTQLKIPSLIATLAVSTIVNGLSFLVTGGVAFVGRLDKAFLFLGRGSLFTIPVMILWMMIAVVACLYFLKQTRTGIHLVCTGEAEEPSRLAGVATRRMKVLGLGLSGLLAAITGILLTSSLSSASPTIAGEYLMTGIAAVLLGMTTIEPGKPNVIGTLIGALIIGALRNGLTLLGAQYYVQDIVLGIIIIASVSLSATRFKKVVFSAPR
ncbi:MAG: ribose ABC transporter permease [marine bacterium B5-7]|nr:MAG: ribose ABC transporter permease [marine bacterium B5-7]